MENKNFTLFLIILTIGLGAYIIWGIPKPDSIEVSIKPYQDSITIIKEQRIQLEHRVDSLNHSYDSLLTVKQKVKTIYLEKFKFIRGASIFELDSIIKGAIR